MRIDRPIGQLLHLKLLEARSDNGERIARQGSDGKKKEPCSFVVALVIVPVCDCVAVTVAEGTTALLGSVTVPEIDPSPYASNGSLITSKAISSASVREICCSGELFSRLASVGVNKEKYGYSRTDLGLSVSQCRSIELL